MTQYRQLFQRLEIGMRAANFEGYDPLDFFKCDKFARLFNERYGPHATFLNKVSPLNFRRILGISRQQNVKANALFVLGYAHSDFEGNRATIDHLIERLLSFRSNDFQEFTLGLSYDTAAPERLARAGKSSLSDSLFGMHAFLEYYHRTSDDTILQAIMSFERLLQSKATRFESPQKLWYSYNFTRVNEIYHITAQVGQFYAMLCEVTGERKYLERVIKILNYLHSVQREDGTWAFSRKRGVVYGYYSTLLLQAVYDMLSVVNHEHHSDMFQKGLHQYKNNLFLDQRPMHLHPLYSEAEPERRIIDTDTRDCANALLLLQKTGDIVKAADTLNWTVDNLCNQTLPYFYFYLNRRWVNKIRFITPQAWMFYAMASYLNSCDEIVEEVENYAIVP